MNEWTFAAEIKSWWDSEFPKHPEWHFKACRVEREVAGSQKRSDLFVDGNGPVMCGELRLPDHPVASPWHPDNLSDAVYKATSSGCKWAFTSDATVLLLLDVERSGPPLSRIVQRFELLPFDSRKDLESTLFLAKEREAWVDALRSIVPTVAGLSPPPGMAPDELFINSLRALLSTPVAAIREEFNQRRAVDPEFERRIVEWMVEEQGWMHLPQNWEDEIRRAAQMTTYVFATRLMFYEALRRSQPSLPPLAIQNTTARIAAATLREHFAEAQDKSRDYKTIFAWDSAAQFALLSDAAVSGWKRVIEHLSVFDLSTISYDLLGKMFERLIDPHERYQWGQHYTNPDVVDFMLSFALPNGSGRVLDPATGGGTFLVRAYTRKRAFTPEQSHAQLLSELYGLEVSAFAATLATVNLAVRQLEFTDNYPRIATRSFFRVTPAEAFMALPAPMGHGLDVSLIPVKMGLVEAVVCNPPYVRIHELGPERRSEAEAALRLPIGNVRMPLRLHRSSNYHVFFWLHAARFLVPDGRLVFITAGEWLDSDYGVPLQEWLLSNFLIEVCIESIAEPWFSEARVGTVVVVAKRSSDAKLRAQNVVRFILLRKPLRELFERLEGSDHFSAVDKLRDRILSIPEGAGDGDDFDWTAIRQDALRNLGLKYSD